MKAKTASPETAMLTAERKLHNTWVYIKRHWQLYLLFLLPAVALTLVFKYAPMGGVLIAFQKYNPFRGIWGSEWVGFKNFTRFMSSPDFQRYLINTLKLSVYGLLCRVRKYRMQAALSVRARLIRQPDKRLPDALCR